MKGLNPLLMVSSLTVLGVVVFDVFKTAKTAEAQAQVAADAMMKPVSATGGPIEFRSTASGLEFRTSEVKSGSKSAEFHTTPATTKPADPPVLYLDDSTRSVGYTYTTAKDPLFTDVKICFSADECFTAADVAEWKKIHGALLGYSTKMDMLHSVQAEHNVRIARQLRDHADMMEKLLDNTDRVEAKVDANMGVSRPTVLFGVSVMFGLVLGFFLIGRAFPSKAVVRERLNESMAVLGWTPRENELTGKLDRAQYALARSKRDNEELEQSLQKFKGELADAKKEMDALWVTITQERKTRA